MFHAKKAWRMAFVFTAENRRNSIWYGRMGLVSNLERTPIHLASRRKSGK
jgi:hypothetical protein